MVFKWQDHGLILDTKNSLLEGNQINYMQGPQAIQLKNKIRVYFSTRINDSTGLPISKVAYVDFTLDFKRRLSEPIFIEISKPAAGGFDEHGIFPFHPYLIGTSVIGALTCGWKRMSNVDIDMSIGQAISLDGHHFARRGLGPVIGPTANEPFLIGDPFVLKFEGTYLLYYIFGTRWEVMDGKPQRIYKIGVAQSTDGIRFHRNFPGRQIVPDILLNEAQAMPTVVEENGILHMFYCYRDVHAFRSGGENAYKINHAISENGFDWSFSSRTINFNFPDWASEMQCYPNALIQSNELFLLYNGNKFGKNGIGLISAYLGG